MGSPGGGTRRYFGGSSARPGRADGRGDSSDDIDIFRDACGLWAIRGLIRTYYGVTWDVPAVRQARIFSGRRTRRGVHCYGGLILWALSLLDPGLLFVLFVLFPFLRRLLSWPPAVSFLPPFLESK